LVEFLGADGGVGLLLGDQTGERDLLAEQLGHVLLQGQRVRLVIVEDSQPDAAERGEPRRDRPRPHAIDSPRTQHRDPAHVVLSRPRPRWPQAFLKAPARSSFIRACTPVLKVGPPPGTAAAWRASRSSRLVAPCWTARRMWVSTPSSRPR